MMLDKSIPFVNVIMRIDKALVKSADTPVLPAGFTYHFFNGAEDIKCWSDIETSVLEFDSKINAEAYFTQSYFPYINDLMKRCIFICNEVRRPVATSTAWYADSELGHQAALHWVAVHPDYQGLGLGKAIVLKALQIFSKLEPDCDVWLHTQTWSHIAIRLYHKLGFNMVKQDRLANTNTRDGIPKIYPNEFSKAIDTLKSVMDDTTISMLVNSAV